MLVKQKAKYIQTLGQKKFREQERLFIAEGPKLVQELLEQDSKAIQEIFALQKWIDDQQSLLAGKLVTPVEEHELEKISQLTTPNQVLAIIQQYEWPQPIITNGQLTLVLDGIQDPGNLGTIIRTTDWFGVQQIVCSMDTADVYNPKVVQSTMGSIARVKLYYVELEEWLSHQSVPVFVTSLSGDDVTTMHQLQEGILVIGNEAKGVRPAVFDKANKKITIPKKGNTESLNASVATGIILSYLA